MFSEILLEETFKYTCQKLGVGWRYCLFTTDGDICHTVSCTCTFGTLVLLQLEVFHITFATIIVVAVWVLADLAASVIKLYQLIKDFKIFIYYG